MQKYLKNREVLVHSLVVEEKPYPDEFQRLVRFREVDESSEREIFFWHYPRVVPGKEIPRFGVDLGTMKDKIIYLKRGRISKLPDGTRHGPFHIMNEECTVNLTGNYKMGQKHGKFCKVSDNYGTKVVVREIWENDRLSSYKKSHMDSTDILKLAGEGSGIYIETWGGKVLKKKNFKNFLLHGVCERYWAEGRATGIRTREIYEEGLMVKRTRYYSHWGGVKQISHYKDGQLHGLRETFGYEGETERREMFENGELVKEWFQ
ncbi:hypothetical protein D1R32_gp427 [Tunisvirus fontaine2]|uniref:MORN repeat-containing protein n=1 Tax=Tunisvirus fontaine2 TaxID=1421067 RepID=V9SGW2_9VIRU|nr:hypothetical protein D1R32_gp427 [Tunisvirus fontaine2]AHC55144.1 hypothetical protein TNS_ORF426 [Tunisvirus fontaine2]